MNEPQRPMMGNFLPLLSRASLVILWVLGLWAWGALLNRTSDSSDLVILAVSLPPAALLFWIAPAYGIIAIMFFASGFLPASFVDVRLSFGGGLEMRDIVVLLMFGVMLLRQLARHTLPLPLAPAGPLLALFLVLVVFSLAYALFFAHVTGHWALSDARILSFYLVFFIAAWGIAQKSELTTVLIGTFVIADITSFIVLIQQILGANSYLVSGMSEGTWGVWESAGGARVVPPGIVSLYFVNLIAIGLVLTSRSGLLVRALLILQALLLSVALLFTFTRSAWVASAIAILIMVSLATVRNPHFLYRIAGGATAAASLLILGSFVLPQQGLTIRNVALLGITDRFSSIFQVNSTIESNSLQWRLFEYQEASKAILKHPLTGVGLGGAYRPITAFQGEAQGQWTDGDISYLRIDRFTRYTHSSYLAIPVKMGIPALIVLLAFVAAVVIISFIFFLRLPNAAARGLALAIGAGLVGLLQWSVLHAHLMLASSTAVIGLVAGLLACLDVIYLRSAPDEPAAGAPLHARTAGAPDVS